MSDAMKLSIDEVLNEAIMSSTPAIIVEGVDDLKTYISIASSVFERCEVYAVEMIAGHSPGCRDVIEAVRSLYNLNDARHPVENFVIGIIDRDAREYRNEIPGESAILTLEYYSLESHFVCEEVLSAFLAQYTLTHPSKFGPAFAAKLFSEIEQNLLEIYYFSLEALQCALDRVYAADFKYSYAIDRCRQEEVRGRVFAKVPELDGLAARLGLQCCLESLRKISTGKWLLSTFCDLSWETLAKLSSYCGEFGSEQCEFCRTESPEKCTFRLKKGINSKTLYSGAAEIIQIDTLEYVRRRLAQISLETLP